MIELIPQEAQKNVYSNDTQSGSVPVFKLATTPHLKTCARRDTTN